MPQKLEQSIEPTVQLADVLPCEAHHLRSCINQEQEASQNLQGHSDNEDVNLGSRASYNPYDDIRNCQHQNDGSG